MELKHLTDQELLAQTKSYVRQERELLMQVLHHLREVDRRRLFSDLKYQSLFEYATKELGYADDAAYRRINALRLLREMPQLEPKIESGVLTLSTLTVASTALRAEVKQTGQPRSQAQKLELISALENKSRREAEVVVSQLMQIPKAELRAERVRLIEDQVELRFLGKASLAAKIQRIKGLLAHSAPDLSTGELFEKLCDQFLLQQDQKINKSLAARKTKKNSTRAQPNASSKTGENKLSQSTTNGTEESDANIEAISLGLIVQDSVMSSKAALNNSSRSKTKSGRYITSETRRLVWRRAQGKCQRCSSERAVQVDHVIPWSAGGTNDISNLRLLCRSCNQRSAIQFFGHKRREKFLGRDRAASKVL